MSVKHWDQLFVSAIVISICYVLISAENKDSVGAVIGIDFGTRYSSVGVIKNGKVEIIANSKGDKVMSSYIAITSEGQQIIGDAAKNQFNSNPENTIFDVKRLIGHKWSDPYVQSYIKYLPFQVVERKERAHIKITTEVGPRIFATEEVVSIVLTKLKKMAENYLGAKVSKAVITVPAHFNYAQRQAIVDVGTIAGFEETRLINEPTAAAIAYGYDKYYVDRNILVFKLGAGSFDVSALNINNGLFKVVATNGDTHLGGNDFDQNVVDYLIEYLIELKEKDIRSDKRAVQKLRREVERAKQILSDTNEALIEILSLFDGEDFSEILTRTEFEELNEDLFRSTLKSIQKVLKDANLDKHDIDDIILIGGSTRIPKIRQLLGQFFDGIALTFGLNDSVVFGATYQSGVIFGEEVSHPCILKDVNPFTIALETDRQDSKMFPKHIVIPVEKTRQLTTTRDDQEGISNAVYEGDGPLNKDNRLLGFFELDGIPPGLKGEQVVDVTLGLNSNGLIELPPATDKINTESRFYSHLGLKAEDIQRMREDVEKFVNEDEKFEKKLETRNQFESYVYSLKNKISELMSCGLKISIKEKKTLKSAVDEMIQWLEANSYSAVRLINAKKRALDSKIGAIMAKLEAGCQEGQPNADRFQPKSDEL